jgi:hypothetical protein
MRAVLALVIAGLSSVLGALLTGRRATLVLSWGWILGLAAAGALVAEAITVLWTGPPASALAPGVDGLGLGMVVGWIAGRPRRPRH